MSLTPTGPRQKTDLDFPTKATKPSAGTLKPLKPERLIDPSLNKQSPSPSSSSPATPLFTRQASLLLPNGEDADFAKTETYAGGFFAKLNRNFWWAVQNPGSACISVMEKGFISGGLESKYNENLQQLATLTGSENLGEFITLLAKPIAAVIRDDHIVQEAIQVGLARMMLNIGMQIQQRTPGKTVTPAEITLQIMETVAPKFAAMQSDLALAAEMYDSSERNARIHEIVSPIVEELMTLAFPKGAQELPLIPGVRWGVWVLIKNKLISEIGNIAGPLSQLSNLAGDEKFKQNPANALLIQTAEQVGSSVTKLTEELLTDSAFATSMSAKIAGAANITDPQLENWLTEQIHAIGVSPNPSIAAFNHAIGLRVEAGLTHIFQNLSGNNQPREGEGKDEDGAFVAAKNVGSLVGKFIAENQEELKAIHENLAAQEKVPEDEKEYQQKFIPLAHALQKQVGIVLKAENQLAFLVEIERTFINETLPKLLAKHYKTLLLPLNDTYRDITHEKNAEPIGLSREKIPALLQSHAPAIGTTTAKGVTLALADLNAKTKAAIFTSLGASLGAEIEETPIASIAQQASLQTKFAELISQRLTALSQSKDPRVLHLWQFLNGPQEDLQKYEQRLAELFSLGLGDKDASETSESLKIIGMLCELAAEKITAAVGNLASEKLAKIFSGEQAVLLKNEDFNHIKDNYIQSVIKSILLQSLVHYLEGIKAEGVDLKSASLKDLTTRLAKTLEKHWIKDGANIRRALTITDPKEQKEALIIAFQPLSSNLIGLIRSPNAKPDVKELEAKESALPITLPFASLLEGIVEDLPTKIIPATLAELCIDTTSWTTKIEKYRTDIQTRTKTTFIPETCRVFGKWISDFLPPFMVRDREDFSETIYGAITEHLKTTGNPKELSVEQYLSDPVNAEYIKENFSEMMFGTLHKDSAGRALLEPFTQEHIEAVLLHACDKLTKRMDDIENPASAAHEKDFLVNLSVRMLNIVNEHFEAVNEVTEKRKYNTAHEVSHEKFVKYFENRGLLHAGMAGYRNDVLAAAEGEVLTPLEAHSMVKSIAHEIRHLRKKAQAEYDPEALKAYRKEIKGLQIKLREAKTIEGRVKENFFKPFGNSLLDLAGIKSAKDLPFPSPVREQVWKLIQSKLMPNVLNNVYETLLDPSTRNQMVKSSLETLKQTLDAEDAMQIQLKAACDDMTEIGRVLKGCKFLVKKEFKDHENDTLMQKFDQIIPLIKSSGDLLEPSFYGSLMRDFHLHGPALKEKVDSLVEQLADLPEIAIASPTPKKAALFEGYQEDLHLVRKKLTAIQGYLEVQAKRITEEEELIKNEDATQKELNIACGGMIKHMVKMIPHTMVNELFKIGKIKDMTAEMIGRAIRRQLGSNWSLLKIIDESVVKGLGSIDPDGVWKGKGASAKFVNSAAFSFPESNEELELAEIANIEKAEKLEEATKKMMIETAHRTISDTIMLTVKMPIVKFKQVWERMIDKILPFSPTIRKFLYWLGNTIVFKLTQSFMGLVADFVTYPFRAVFWFFMDWHISSRVEHAYKNLHLDIHENLFFKLSEELIESLKEGGQEKRASTTGNIFFKIMKKIQMMEARAI